MAHRLDPPLMPRSGGILRVPAVCRSSGPNQDFKALEDQEALHRLFVAGHIDGPTEGVVIATCGPGEPLDRGESIAIQEASEIDPGGLFDGPSTRRDHR